MEVINFVGGLVNGKVGNYSYNLKDFPETILIVGIFSGAYFITTTFKTKINNTYRLPIIRTIFWTVLILIDVLNFRTDSLYNFTYLLALNNGLLCFFYDTLLFKLYNGMTGYGSNYFQVFAIDILIFAAYELLIIKTATYILESILKENTKVLKPL